MERECGWVVYARTIRLVDHLLQLLIGHVLAELLGDTLQVLEGDLASLVIVEQAEGLQDLLTRVTLAHLGGHHVKKLIEVNGAVTVFVDAGFHRCGVGLNRIGGRDSISCIDACVRCCISSCIRLRNSILYRSRCIR